MPGQGVVEVIYADCRNTKEPDNHYDFVHSNPPFFSLEPYGESDADLASMGSYRYNMVSKTYEENKMQTICYASRIAAVIYPNGDVHPCEILDSSKKIGNLRDYDMNFRKLWRSKRNQEIADWIVKTKCFCTHECNVACNTTFNLKHFTKIALKAKWF